ncbi:MAG: DUF2269 domain-containing protein [Hyphomicrobiaceae bacterium]
MTVDLYPWLKLAHLVGAAVLLGTGAGIAFFMLMADRTGEPVVIHRVARMVVLADLVFTATAVIAQPLTGSALALWLGYHLTETWILASLGLYLLVGTCWLPVVWIQLKIRDLAADAVQSAGPLPDRYHKLMRIWFWLGWPAFLGVIAIYWLMIVKP